VYNVAYRQTRLNDKVGEGKIISCHTFELKNLNDFLEGQKRIAVFNNLVNNKEELETNWEVPLEKCW